MMRPLRGGSPSMLVPILGGIGATFLIIRQNLAETWTHLFLLGLTLILAGFALVILINWRIGLFLLPLWLIFEDLPRKYLGNNMVIYFGKDILVAIAYVSFLLDFKRGRVQLFRPPFLAPLLLFVCFGLGQAFNPNSPSLLYGLLGVKLYFYYMPLMFLGYCLIVSERNLIRFLVLNLTVAALVSVLGLIQMTVGPEFLSPRVLPAELETQGHVVRYAPISGAGVTRPTSVFVSESRFGSYMFLIFVLSLGSAGYLFAIKSRWRPMPLISAGLAGTSLFLHGSRGGLLHGAASLLILMSALFLNLPKRRQDRTRVKAASRLVAIALGFTLAGVFILFPGTVEARWAFYSETLAPWSPASELGWRVWGYPVMFLAGAFDLPHWLVGHGIGTTSLGVQYVTGLLGAPALGVFMESGYAALITEMGILGPLLWVGWTAALVLSGWRVLRGLRGTPVFPVAAAILWFAFSLLFPQTYGGIASYQNYIFNAYLWLLVGILFRLPSLARPIHDR